MYPSEFPKLLKLSTALKPTRVSCSAYSIFYNPKGKSHYLLTTRTRKKTKRESLKEKHEEDKHQNEIENLKVEIQLLNEKIYEYRNDLKYANKNADMLNDIYKTELSTKTAIWAKIKMRWINI